MKSSLVFSVLSLLLFTVTIEGRKDPGEYWKGIMNDQQMPEAIKGFMHDGDQETEKTKHCLDQIDAVHHGDEKSFDKDFEPRPNVSVYHGEVVPDEKKSFVKDFEPRPNVSVYHDGVASEDKKSFAKDFEPRPNVSVYHE
ncbi:hypothetical protein Ancab_027451 [Ancistrocladus abbreviatus]